MILVENFNVPEDYSGGWSTSSLGTDVVMVYIK